MADETELAATARAFLAVAFRRLEDQHVLPRPRFRPHVRVGKDYFGSDVWGPEHAALETAIASTHARFGEDEPLGSRDFAGSYLHSFLGDCVARCTKSGEPLSPHAGSIDLALNDLCAALASDEREVAVCRHVSHLTTVGWEPLVLNGLTVLPLRSSAANHRGAIHEALESVIADSASAWEPDDLLTLDNPESIVVARALAADPFARAEQLSGEVERFLLLVRLLHSSTSSSSYELQGETSPVRKFSPILVQFRGDHTFAASTRLIRRAARLDASDNERIAGLAALLDAAEAHRPNMVSTSFAMAVTKFRISYHAHAWWEQIVDLATAFEAALSGQDRNDVLLRLRTRAGALLATPRDPAGAIFADIGKLYEVRSRLVHGGELTSKELTKQVTSITTVPTDAPFGIALNHAVDRLRDLVRRSILVRICLGAPTETGEALWPLGSDPGVDAALSDDGTRAQWQQGLRTRLEGINAVALFDRPSRALDFLSPGDDA